MAIETARSRFPEGKIKQNIYIAQMYLPPNRRLKMLRKVGSILVVTAMIAAALIVLTQPVNAASQTNVPGLAEKVPPKLLNGPKDDKVKVYIVTTDINELGNALRSLGVDTKIGSVPAKKRLMFPVVEVPRAILSEVSKLGSVMQVMEYKYPEIDRLPEEYVKAVNDDVITKASGGVAPQMYFATQHHHAADAWASGFTGKGVNIAIVDTGVDFGNPDLQGVQARVTDTTSPYYGYPIVFDSSSLLIYLAYDGWAPLGYSWFADTSYESDATPEGYVPFDGNWYCVDGIPSYTGKYHLGYHPDVNLQSAYLSAGYEHMVAVLVSAENRTGDPSIYDTVYVDLDNDLDFTDEKPCYIWRSASDPMDAEISWSDNYNATSGEYGDTYDSGDGFADISGGMIYFIADGNKYIPYEDLYASYYGVSPILPDNGCLVAFSLDNDGHGTGCSGTAAGQGRIPFAGADGNLYYLGKGMAPDAKIINVPIFNVLSDTYDAWFFAVEGYDGDPTTPEDGAQICSNSFGYSSSYDDGWNMIDRYLYFIAAMYAGGVTTFTIANGNGGPGYGTITTPTNPYVVNVGAATEMGYRIPYGYESGTGGAKYGDIIPFSGRGPTAMGYHGPDIVAVGAYGWAAIPLWQIFDGSAAGDLFSGTSQACPAAAGALALIYDATKQATGTFPTATVAKRYLTLGADDIHYDVFSQGSGYINCKRSVDIAARVAGIYSTLSFWQPGTSTGLPGGSKPTMFAKMMFPGTSDSTTFTLYNDYHSNVMVHLDAKQIVKIGEATTDLTTTETVNRWWLKLSDLITNSTLRNSTQLLKVTAYYDYSVFDMKNDYTDDVVYRVDIHDWTDANGNGVMDNKTLNQEFNRYTVELVTGNVQEAWIHDPVARSHDDTIIEVRPYKYKYSTHGPVTIHLLLECYAQQDWPLITFSQNDFILAPYGQTGYSRSITANIAVPSDYGVGCYEGAIIIDDGTNTSVIPVSLNVAGNFTNDAFVFGSNTLDTIYENSKVRGKYDWGWRAETGDWRFYFIWVKTSLTDLTNQYMLLDLKWQYAPTDIDAYIQGPKSDGFSASYPSVFGPYTLGTIGRSSNSYASAGKYTFDSSTDGPRDIVFAPLRPGLNQIILHNTLLNATDYPESFTWELSRMYYKSWTTDLYAYVTDHVYTTGKVGEVAINSSKDWDGMSSKVDSMTTTVYTNQIVYQDNPDDYTTASWVKPVKVLGASMLKIAITRVGNPSDDLDLFLVYDANNNGQYDSGDALKAYSATSAALEAINYKNPADGTYFVLVHGWSVPGGSDNFDISIGIGSKMPLFSCVGMPTVVKNNTLYTFDIMANIPPLGGVFGATVGFGPENSGKTFSVDVQAEIEDGAAPELQVSSPADGSYVTTATPLIKARYTDDVVTSAMNVNSVVMKVDGITVTSQAKIDPDAGEISFTPLTALPEGKHTVYVSAKDSYGNGASITWAFTVDTVPPTLVVTAPTGGEITNNPTLKVKGYTDAVDSDVTINGNAVPLAADGSFDYPVALSEGSNTITVEATDVAGHTVQIMKKVTLDTKAPTLTVTAPAQDAIVSTSVITVTGTTEKNAVVMVNGNYATVDSSGNFAATVTLAEGQNAIQVTSRDAAGNIAKATVNVVLDTIAPAITVTTPVEGAIFASGTAEVAGTVVDANLATLKVNGNVVTVTNNAFSTSVTLVEGANAITLEATDLAGNVKTVVVNVVLDTQAPTLSVTASATETKVPVVTLNGTVSDAGTGVAKVTVNGNLVTVGSDGKFTANVGLLEGTNTITVIAYDVAGNAKTSTLSVKYNYVPELGDVNNKINQTNQDLNNAKDQLNNKIDDTKNNLSDSINSTGLNAMLLAVLGIILAVVAIVLQFVMKPKPPATEAPKEWSAPTETPSEPATETTPSEPTTEEPKP